MTAVFTSLTGAPPDADCSTGEDALDVWYLDDVLQGPLACFSTEDGQSVFLWADTEAGVLSAAYDPLMPLDEMFTWWSG